MAYPTGNGSERLKRFYIHAASTGPNYILTGVALHIYTVISVVFCEQGNVAENFEMIIDIGAAGNDIYILDNQPIPARGTFVFSDKIVLEGLDKMRVNTETGANLDVWISYIDQDWS